MAAAVSTQGLTKKYLDVWNKAEITAVDKWLLRLDRYFGPAEDENDQQT